MTQHRKLGVEYIEPVNEIKLDVAYEIVKEYVRKEKEKER